MSKKNVSICAFIGLFECIFSAVVLHRAQLYAYSFGGVHLEWVNVSVCVRACVRLCVHITVWTTWTHSAFDHVFFALLLRLSSSTFVSIFVLTLYPSALNQIIIIKTPNSSKWMKENDVKNRQIVLYLQLTALNAGVQACMCIDIYIMLYFAIDTRIASNLWN